jgi:hypothetical protein
MCADATEAQADERTIVFHQQRFVVRLLPKIKLLFLRKTRRGRPQEHSSSMADDNDWGSRVSNVSRPLHVQASLAGNGPQFESLVAQVHSIAAAGSCGSRGNLQRKGTSMAWDPACARPEGAEPPWLWPTH